MEKQVVDRIIDLLTSHDKEMNELGKEVATESINSYFDYIQLRQVFRTTYFTSNLIDKVTATINNGKWEYFRTYRRIPLAGKYDVKMFLKNRIIRRYGHEEDSTID